MTDVLFLYVVTFRDGKPHIHCSSSNSTGSPFNKHKKKLRMTMKQNSKV